MSRRHKPVRIWRTPLTRQWEVVRLAKDGITITDRWPLHPDDQTRLDTMLAALEGNQDQ